VPDFLGQVHRAPVPGLHSTGVSNCFLFFSIVGGFNPSEKYARQLGSFPQVGVKIKKYLKATPTVDG